MLQRAVAQRSNDGWKLTEKIVDGQHHYDLHMVTASRLGQVEIDYYISPQIPLGQAQNVGVYTVSDYYFRPVGAQVNGKEVPDISVCPDVALFLDGYTYHASLQHLRFFGDVDRRAAINAAGDKTTWTLTWDDLERAEAEKVEHRADKLWSQRQERTYQKTREKLRSHAQFDRELADAPNSWERFLWQLAHPLPDQHAQASTGLLLSLFQQNFLRPSVTASAVPALLRFEQAIDPAAVTSTTADSYLITHELLTHFAKARVAVKLPMWSIEASALLYREVDEALDKHEWEHFWHLYNLIQRNLLLVKPSPNFDDSGVAEQLPYYDKDLHHIVKSLYERGIDFGQDGSFFLPALDGQHAEAAVGIADLRLFIRPLSEADRVLFLAAGYLEVEPAKFSLDLLIT